MMQNGLLPQQGHEVNGGDWYFYAAFVAIIIFVVIRWLNPRYFPRLIQATLSNYEAHRLIKEKNIRMQQALILLFLLSILTFSLFWVIQAAAIPRGDRGSPSFSVFIKVFAFISVILAIRLQSVKFLGGIFHIKEISDKLNQIWIVQIHILGTTLGFVAILLPYLPFAGPEIATFTGYTLVIIWAIYNIFRQLQLLTQNRISLFYRILYLCAFEILPLWWIVEITIKGWSE